MSTFSIIEVFYYVYYFYVYVVVMGCFVRTSFSAVVSLLLLRLIDYCVCGVRMLSTLVSGFSSGSRLGEFLTNWLVFAGGRLFFCVEICVYLFGVYRGWA